MSNQQSILLVEDDFELAQLITDYLSSFHYQVYHVSNGLDAVDFVHNTPPDLVILDLMLPGLDGMEVCKRIRQNYEGALVMLTVRDDNIDEILGLEIGADDYLTKPVEPRRLIARVKALLRRMPSNSNEAPPGCTKPLICGNLEIYESSRTVKQNSREIKLTIPEFDLLLLLVKNQGMVISREDIFMKLKGINYDGMNRSIDILVSYLRAKLGDPSIIRTIRGKGYLFPQGQ